MSGEVEGKLDSVSGLGITATLVTGTSEDIIVGIPTINIPRFCDIDTASLPFRLQFTGMGWIIHSFVTLASFGLNRKISLWPFAIFL